jgi:hypothetical protein
MRRTKSLFYRGILEATSELEFDSEEERIMVKEGSRYWSCKSQSRKLLLSCKELDEHIPGDGGSKGRRIDGRKDMFQPQNVLGAWFSCGAYHLLAPHSGVTSGSIGLLDVSTRDGSALYLIIVNSFLDLKGWSRTNPAETAQTELVKREHWSDDTSRSFLAQKCFYSSLQYFS